MVKLTTDQLDNWRSLIHNKVGSYALLMSDKEVQEYYEKTQQTISECENKITKKTMEL